MIQNKISSQELFISYIAEKKTLNSLAKENNICEKTLRNRVFTIKIAKPQKLILKEIILLIDATYWAKTSV